MHLTSKQTLEVALFGGLVTTAAALARAMRPPAHARAAAFSRSGADDVGEGTVRTAGPEAMRDPPRDWSQTDESSDESFPASDPASSY